MKLVGLDWRQRGKSLALSATLVAVVGCGSNGPEGPLQAAGELGNGTFAYTCAALSDAACDESADALKASNLVAVGSRFGMTFKPRESVSPIRIEAVSPTLLQRVGLSGNEFEVLGGGYVGLMAKQGQRVLDITHLGLAPVASVAAEVRAPGAGLFVAGDRVELAEYESAQLRVVPRDADGKDLRGALPCLWTASDESLLSFGDSATDNVVTLSPRGVGTTVAHVKLGGFEKEITIVITAGGSGGGGTGGQGGQGGQGGSTGTGGSGGGL